MTPMRATEILNSILGPRQDSALDAGRSVTFRYADSTDALALLDLAAVDSSRPPEGTVLVAEVGGRLWAAQSLDDGHSVADPFKPSGELAFLLAERARQILQPSAPREDHYRMHLRAA